MLMKSDNMDEKPQSNPNAQQVEKIVMEYQTVAEQLRSISMQIDQLNLQKDELSSAEKEVGNAAGKIYRGIGGVIVETQKEDALADIKDKMELNELRLKTANKQYTDLKNREKELREKISGIAPQA